MSGTREGCQPEADEPLVQSEIEDYQRKVRRISPQRACGVWTRYTTFVISVMRNYTACIRWELRGDLVN